MPNSNDPIPDPLRTTATYVYDSLGRVVTAVDPPGNLTWTLYDSEGRRLAGDGPSPVSAPEEPPDEPHIVG